MEPSPAATVVVARAGEGAPEILALGRAERSRFAPGFVVFPDAVEDVMALRVSHVPRPR
jgi:hypothetical protein